MPTTKTADERSMAYVQRVTSISDAYLLIWARPWQYYTPPIASGRFTRGRLAAYWELDDYVLVPHFLGDLDPDNSIPPNEPRMATKPGRARHWIRR